ncbi:MAG: hypothetical protein ACE5H1_01180 [Thermodesulfobacteriota bacterium]
MARSELKEVGKLRYYTSTTSQIGAPDGTTLISSNLLQHDDAFNGMEVRITDNINVFPSSNERRIVADWVKSTSTLTLVEGFSEQIGASRPFELGEAGFISDHQLIEFFTEAQNDMVLKLPSDAFEEILVSKTVTASPAGIAAFPKDIVGLPNAVRIGNTDVIILPRNQEDKFQRHAYLGTTDEPIGIYKNGEFHYKPTSQTKVVFEVLPVLANFTFTDGSPLPSYLHNLQVKYTVAQGWRASQRLDIYNAAKAEYDESIKALTQ